MLTASGNLIGTVGLPTTTSTVIEQRQVITSATSGTSSGTPTTSVAATPPAQPKKARNPPDPSRVPLYIDERLPPGWHRKVSQRKSGASAGRYEVFIIGPTGKRFRSRNELKAFFEKTGENVLTPEHFDFSTFGTNVISALPKQYQKKPETEIDPGMPKLTPMVGGPTSNVVASAGSSSSSAATSSGTVPPVFKSQLSRDTEEADAQISQLLESLQKGSSSKKILTPDSEEMSKMLFNSLPGEDNSCSSPPPTIVKPPNLTANPSTSSASKINTSGVTGFQASFLNSITSPEKGNNVSEANNLPVGGASTQRRALHNLPQNTKLVRGPNGQYSLQKVQTIELTLEQQTVSFIS